MTGMLASVTNISEVRIVLNAGANIIDLKNPAKGALGALDAEQVRKIRTNVGPHPALSATIGDLPMKTDTILNAVTEMSATGVDYVKIGFFPGGNWADLIDALGGLAQARIQLVAVFFGDTEINIKWVAHLAKAGFAGAMIDTRDKTNGSLTTVCSKATLESFVYQVQTHQLLCGLAGSLKKDDIPQLLELAPDYLGFRGALCVQNQRTNTIDEREVRAIRMLIDNGNQTQHSILRKQNNRRT